MKRLISILLLFLFLLNVLGYYGVFMGLQVGSSINARTKLDRGDYATGNLITIKAPLTVPYSVDQNEYERVDGEFQHNGEYFRLVKQKLYKDTLFIVCIKDDGLRKMHQALADYVKTFTDSPVNSGKSSSNGKSALTFIQDYISETTCLKFREYGWTKTLVYFSPESAQPVSFSPSINHPPEV